MKEKVRLSILLFFIFLVLFACDNKGSQKSQSGDQQGKKGELKQIGSIEGFSSLSGFKVDKGLFYFTGVKNDQWRFYSLDLKTQELIERQKEIGEYELYIPLDGDDAVYVDINGQLFYRKNDKEFKIDEEVFGPYTPNVLISPDLSRLLYTKGKRESAALYQYRLGDETPLKVKNSISGEAFYTFSYTTHWSNRTGYFIFDNDEIYDDRGKLYAKIGGTAAKWAPNDEMIAFIKKPDNLEASKIYVGDWQSYIGDTFILFNIKDKKEEIIYRETLGLIDAIDSIQWAKDSSLAAISYGKINRGSTGELESVDYEKIFVYDIKNKKKYIIDDMPYNFYEILFYNHVYGSSLGKRDVVEIVQIFNGDRKKFNEPVLLNSKDMFVISSGNEAYLLNGKKLVKINDKGEEIVIKDLPWEVSEMYFDKDSKQLIIINRDLQLFLIAD